MNCNTFRNKLYDYLEGNMSLDMRETMEMHMKHCEVCRKVYMEEKELEECFKEAFETDISDFTSSRAAIMKSIDKNRYSKSPFNKLKFNLKRHRRNYIAAAAILVLAFFTAPYIANRNKTLKASDSTSGITEAQSKNNSAMADGDINQAKRFVQGAGTNDTAVKNDTAIQPKMAEIPSASESKAKNRYMPKFIKTPTDSKTDIKFGTAWKVSPNGKFQVSLDGKGPNAGEEGIAEILVNDKQSNSKWFLSLTDNDRQYSPKYAEWLDNENLLVIVGLGYGTVSQGGEVFKLNINTASTELVYAVQNDREQVVSVKKG